MNDSDLEMAELDATARQMRRLRKQGICVPSATVPVSPGSKERKCVYCGEVFESEEAAHEAYRERMI